MKGKWITAACLFVSALVLGGCGGTGQSEDAGQSATAGGSRETRQSGAAGEEPGQTERADGGMGQAESAGGGTGQTEDTEAGWEEAGAGGTAAPSLPAGAAISILGDSISTYQGCNPVGYYAFYPENGEVKGVEDTWWQIAADDLGLTIYQNGSSAGATVAGDSDGTEDPQCACNEFRTNDLAGAGGVCPDGIIVYLGTNDLLEAVPLGDNDGTSVVLGGEVDIFSDAYTLMLDKLQANYPLAQIYCCTLLPVGDYGTKTPYVEFVNGAGLTAADYGEVIARIAENRGFPVIDLYHCGITIENLQEMTSDGVHPTAEGMRRIAAAVEKSLAG